VVIHCIALIIADIEATVFLVEVGAKEEIKEPP
jgi:hypothetical protein